MTSITHHQFDMLKVMIETAFIKANESYRQQDKLFG